MGKFDDMAMGWANGAAGAAMGLVLGDINDKRQLRQQERLSEQQWKFSKRAAEFNQQQQYDMWLKTNYGAQKEQMKKAGLSPGLMYGMSGGGGTTVGSSNASVSGGGAPVGGGEAMGMMRNSMDMALLKAQKENIEADTKNKLVNANKTAGVDTELAGTQIESLTQGIAESKQRSELMEVQTNLAEIEKNFKNDTYKASVMGLKYNTDIALQQLNILRNDAVISDNTWSAKVEMIQSEAAGILLRNALTRAQTSNTETDTALKSTNINSLIQGMQAQIKQLQQKDRELSQGDKELIIQEARNRLIELGIWVGAGSQVLGDAVNLLKRPTQINNKKDIIIRDSKEKGPY